MSEFVEVKTADLEGAALDWMTMVAFGWLQRGTYIEHATSGMQLTNKDKPKLSTDWSCADSLTRQAVEMCKTAEGLWMAVVPSERGGSLVIEYHDSLLVALCRAIVAAKLGDVVQVPADLMEVVA